MYRTINNYIHNVCVHIQTNKNTCIYIYIYTCMNVCMCVCIYWVEFILPGSILPGFWMVFL